MDYGRILAWGKVRTRILRQKAKPEGMRHPKSSHLAAARL
jgi:hypothetical protein